MGVPLKLLTHARDLGIDAAGGRRRRTTTKAKRWLKSRQRYQRIRTLTLQNARAARFAKTGALLQTIRGNCATGTPLSQLRRLRSRVLQAHAVKTRGRSVYLAMRLRRLEDPVSRVVEEHLRDWAQCCGDLTAQQSSVV